MNPERQRIVIAEHCGWTDCHKTLAGFDDGEGITNLHVIGIPPDSTIHRKCPDYLNDLNAIDSAVLSLLNSSPSQLNWDYAKHLGIVTGSSHPEMGVYVSTALIHATAAQRAEAFLRTLNKWEDTP